MSRIKSQVPKLKLCRVVREITAGPTTKHTPVTCPLCYGLRAPSKLLVAQTLPSSGAGVVWLERIDSVEYA